MASTILTIGHSNHPIDTFISMLKSNGVEAVCDVRSSPYSRMHPQYHRERLADSLKRNGIAYVFLGKELGARSDDPRCYRNGKVQYGLLANTKLFQEGILRLETGTENYRIALMCAEREPLGCHRTILVAKHLVDHGFDVDHILAGGRIEPHSTTLARLMGRHKLATGDLFMADDDLAGEAYRRQADRIAYVRRVETSNARERQAAAER